MIVTSLENNKVKRFCKLQKKKYRDQYGEFIVEGLHLVLEAYKSGYLEELIVEEGVELPFSCPYTYYSSDVMKKISTMDTPCNIMGLCKKNLINEIKGNKTLILDELQDPGNLGTIIRSAKAFNVDTVVLTENTVDLYNPKVLRATQGMFFHINIINMSVNDIFILLHNNEIPVYGTSVTNGFDVRTLSNKEKEKYALILGNEGNGVSQNILDLCDKNLYIKMNDDVESLNVAIAASILLYELGR